MQPSSTARKIRLLIDGNEIIGLVKWGEVNLEKGTIDVPSYTRINKIDNGVTTMPEVAATFELRRDTDTRRIITNYYKNGETHDLTVIGTDADGVEIERDLFISTRCRKLTKPEADLASPTFNQLQVAFLPYDIVSL